MNQKKLLIRLTSLIIFIFIVNFVAMKFHWYYSLWWLDMPMHFLGGLWLALVSIYIFSLKEVSFKPIFKIMCVVLLIGIFWEIFEIIVNDSIAQNPFNILDTISDIAFDLAGGLAGLFYCFKRIMSTPESNV